jgi:hypothetical protein
MHVVAQICDAPLLNEATRSRLIMQTTRHRSDVAGATLLHRQGIERV